MATVVLVCTAGVVTAREPQPHRRCEVVGSDKLVAAIGGSSAICAEITRMIAEHVPGVPFSISLAVLGPARLAATLTVDGRTLPVQNFAVMDGQVNQASIKRFATALAAAALEAGKP